jgi:hypothetical protein
MSESEKNANRPTLNEPIDEALAEIEGAADDEDKKAKTDEPLYIVRYESERLYLENRRLEDENAELSDVHELRKEYIPKLYWLTVTWLIFVVILVWKVAEGPYFYLSDRVLITLVTSTTVNVIGIFMLAARWLFPPKK